VQLCVYETRKVDEVRHRLLDVAYGTAVRQNSFAVESGGSNWARFAGGVFQVCGHKLIPE
jgi:hypothetical protein